MFSMTWYNSIRKFLNQKKMFKTLRDSNVALNMVYAAMDLEMKKSSRRDCILHKSILSITFSYWYESIIFLPSSKYNPSLDKVEFFTEYTFSKSVIDYIVDINKKHIPNKYETSTPELLQAIHNASTMPFCIDEQMFVEFLELIKKIAELETKDLRRIDYISTLYDVDFATYMNQFMSE